MYILYINYVPVYDGAVARRVEMFNESILLLVNYHIMVFANNRAWINSRTNSTLIGASAITFIALLLSLNTLIILIATCKDLQYKLRLKKLSKKNKLIIKEREKAITRISTHIEFCHSE